MAGPLHVRILDVVDHPSEALILHDPDILLGVGHFHKVVAVTALDHSTVVDWEEVALGMEGHMVEGRRKVVEDIEMEGMAGERNSGDNCLWLWA